MLENWIDQAAIATWHYPVDFPLRSYQFNIVQECLFKNTLVSLPTGMGKTFVAGVVMLNYLRWFPFGKVVFLAPTKPLVAQQKEACKGVGIAEEQMIELTGHVTPSNRSSLWKSKRVFFMTPQVLHNDILKGICPTDFIVCIVVDESHRAQGKHSYCEGIRELFERNRNFRIVALTATPASTTLAVQKIIDNLMIAHVEIRTEESIDIRPFIHHKKIESIIITLTGELQRMKEITEKELLAPFIKRLCENGAFYERDPARIGKAMILKLREVFRCRSRTSASSYTGGLVESDFAALLSFVHCYELLLIHGIYNFYHHLSFISSDQSSKLKGFLLKNQIIVGLMNGLKDSFASPSYNSIQKSHPKMIHIERNLIDFFTENPHSKAIVFAEFRDTVNQIVLLLQHYPSLIQVASFVGKSDSKMSKGLNQKGQIEIVNNFREGKLNVLVSTSIGEEGLDIGEVDLIICYDAQTSPIRMLQRFGRTGRKRQGKVVMLLTKGKEENKHKQTTSSYKAVQDAICNHSLQLFKSNPRMVPEGISPKCIQIKVNSLPESCFDQFLENELEYESSCCSSGLITPIFMNQQSNQESDTHGSTDLFINEKLTVLKSPNLNEGNNLDMNEKSTIYEEIRLFGLENMPRVKDILNEHFKAEMKDIDSLNSAEFYSQTISSLDFNEIDKVFDIFNGTDHNCNSLSVFSNTDKLDSLTDIPADFFQDDWENDLMDNGDSLYNDYTDNVIENAEKVKQNEFMSQPSSNESLTSSLNITNEPMGMESVSNADSKEIQMITTKKAANVSESPFVVKSKGMNSKLLINSQISTLSSPLQPKRKKMSDSKCLFGNFLDIEAEKSQDFLSSEFTSASEIEEMDSFINDDEDDNSAEDEEHEIDYYRKSLLMSQLPEFTERSKFGKDGKFKVIF